MTYRYVVLGDVVASREIDDREAFGRTVADACETVNEACSADLDAPFELLKGVDELGGVLATPACVYDVVDEFAAALRPHEVRIAVAAGEIDVGVDTGDVTQMDGPAFHRADSLLTDLDGGAFRFAMDLEDSPLDDVLTDEINLLRFRKRDWTDRQREVVALYEEYEDQAAVADDLGISQPAVSRALDRAMWQPLREIEDRLRGILTRYD